MKRLITGVLVGLALFAASPVGTAGASTANGLRCRTWMSNNRPRDYTTIYVRVSTVRYAGITTVAHYKTVNRRHTGKANARGNANIPYYISGATPGYRVVVSVTVKSGSRHGSCWTAFIPHR